MIVTLYRLKGAAEFKMRPESEPGGGCLAHGLMRSNRYESSNRYLRLIAPSETSQQSIADQRVKDQARHQR
jgi:hypothetical protein